MRTANTVAATALAVCMAGLAGCSTTGTPDGAPSVPRTERARDDLLKRAERALVERCLTRRGLAPDDILSVPGTPSSGAPSATRSSGGRAGRYAFPHGIDDPAWAAEHGFGLRPGAASARTPETARQEARGQEPRGRGPGGGAAEERRREAVAAVFGGGRHELSVRLATGHTVSVHTDGCLATAQRELYGDQERWIRAQVVVNNQRAEADQRLREDPGYRDALGRWARCMSPVRAARSPVDLRRIWERETREVSAAEADRLQRRLAVAEARCTRSTGLARTGRRLEDRHLDRVRAAHAEENAEYRRLRAYALKAAVRPAAPPEKD